MNNVINLTLKSDCGVAEASYASAPSPFLSILTRTQGRRLHTLAEMLTCLAAQSVTDFEVLLLGHCLDPEDSALVQALVADCPAWLRGRIRFIAVEGGNRTRPLQLGFAEAAGDYVAVLDDDDIIFAHWVERFRDLARAHPGRVVRGNTVVQVVDTVSVQGIAGLRAEQSPELRYPKTFNFFEHILQNRSPLMTLCFPRQQIALNGIDFNETLTTTEDWDFFIRCAWHLGVADAGGITSVYRWWGRGESSRSVHTQAEWQTNYYRVWDSWDAAGFRLPPGGLRELAAILQEHAAFGDELRRQQTQGVRLELDLALINRDAEQRLAGAKRRAQKILNSTCWRATRPLRQMVHLLAGEREIDAAWLQSATVEQIEALVCALYESHCWRLAAPLRMLKRMLDRFFASPVAPR